jgi:hypothetical protein
MMMPFSLMMIRLRFRYYAMPPCHYAATPLITPLSRCHTIIAFIIDRRCRWTPLFIYFAICHYAIDTLSPFIIFITPLLPATLMIIICLAMPFRLFFATPLRHYCHYYAIFDAHALR